MRLGRDSMSESGGLVRNVKAPLPFDSPNGVTVNSQLSKLPMFLFDVWSMQKDFKVVNYTILQELHEESRGCGTTSDHSTSNRVGKSSAGKLGTSSTTSLCTSVAGKSTGRGGRGWPRLGDGEIAGWFVRDGSGAGSYRCCTTIVVRSGSDRNKVRAESSVNKVGEYCKINQHPECTARFALTSNFFSAAKSTRATSQARNDVGINLRTSSRSAMAREVIYITVILCKGLGDAGQRAWGNDAFVLLFG